MGLLSRLAERAARGANNRGLLGRLRAAGDDFLDEPSPGYARIDVFPERMWNMNEPTRRASSGGMPDNWNLSPEEQAALDSLPPLERARALAQNGEGRALSAYERSLLRKRDPKEASRALWGMEEEPTLEMAPGASDEIARMFKANGELASPEEFLGRPLTPDHIWNDPRFRQRMDMTNDLEGARTLEERFHIAEQREMLAQQGPHKAATERWGVDDPIVRMMLLGGSGGGLLSLARQQHAGA